LHFYLGSSFAERLSPRRQMALKSGGIIFLITEKDETEGTLVTSDQFPSKR
jgi:hypothetical protein